MRKHSIMLRVKSEHEELYTMLLFIINLIYMAKRLAENTEYIKRCYLDDEIIDNPYFSVCAFYFYFSLFCFLNSITLIITKMTSKYFHPRRKS